MNDVEKKLILACARISLSPRIVSKIRDCASRVTNWQVVFDAANTHGVNSLLYTNLKKACPDSVPAEIMEKLRAAYVSNTKKNLSYSAALLKILEIFSRNDILAVPFKGPLLAEQVYGDIGLRQFSDLDILVGKCDVMGAKNLLINSGFKIDITLDRKNEEKYLEFENSFSFFSPQGGPSIDLHWEMSGRYLLKPLYIETFHDKLKQIDFMGQKVFSIPDDLLLIYLCIHANSHCWERLEWLSCFAEMAHRQNENHLSRTIGLAKEMGCRRMFHLGLYMSFVLLDMPLPDSLLSELLCDRGLVNAGKKIEKIIFSPKTHTHGDADWRFSPLHIQVRDTRFDGLKYAICLYTIPTIKEWLKYPLPSRLSFLYRLFRPIRLGKAFLLREKIKTVSEG